MNKVLTTTFLFAAFAASPALAQSTEHTAKSRAPAAQAQPSAPPSANGAFVYNDPYVVVLGNQVVGRDPDPNIRLQLKRDPYTNE
jgi:hypothetical protein